MPQTLKGVVQVKLYRFEWRIERFFADSWGSGISYKSPVSSIPYADKMINWHLQIYPKGINEKKYEDYVSLFIKFDSEIRINMAVDIQCSIIDVRNSLPMMEINATNYRFVGGSGRWGRADYVQQSFIQNTQNGAMLDDTLTILCKIKFHSGNNFCDYDEWLTKIGQGFDDYEELFENGSFADVTFIVQGKQINLHKAVLSCRSPVFKAMLQHDMKENKQGSVDITDIDYDIMKELLRFLYSRKVKNIENIASDLLIAADKYQMIELKALCEKTIYDELTVDNAIEYLKLTEICDTIHLKKRVINFIADHSTEVVKKSEFANLNSTMMYEIIVAIVK